MFRVELRKLHLDEGRVIDLSLRGVNSQEWELP